jgi:uncharacterized protein
LENAFREVNIEVLLYDLSFRQARPNGPPKPGDAARDRQGLREQILKIREKRPERLWLGGHSYGGRQSTILAAEAPEIVDVLLLLSYPLHPPRKPAELRTAHFPMLRTPALFVHGSRDPFASTGELKDAIALIPAHVRLLEIEGAGHDLGKNHSDVALRIVESFLQDCLR